MNIIAIYTRPVAGSKFSARAQAGPADIKSNFPPVKLGCYYHGKDEEAAALGSARKAVKMLHPYRSGTEAVRRIGAGAWEVYFKPSQDSAMAWANQVRTMFGLPEKEVA